MNIFSHLKKILVICFFVFLLWGNNVDAAGKKVPGGNQVGSDYIISDPLGLDEVLVDLILPNKNIGTGVGGVFDTKNRLVGGELQALEYAVLAAEGRDFDDLEITDTIYYIKTPSGVMYVENKGDGNQRLIAVTTPTGTFVADFNEDKESAKAKAFVAEVAKQSNIDAATFQQEFYAKDSSAENIEAQKKILADIRKQIAEKEAALQKLKEGNASPAAIQAAEQEIAALKEKEKAQQDLVDGVVKTQKNQEDTSCSINTLFTLNCVLTPVAYISTLIFKLSAFVLGLAGNLLDYSIELSVNSAEFIESLNIVNPMWGFIRDSLNMTFIFILLYIAINMILGRTGLRGNSYTLKSDVLRVVLVAIFINFSLFFAKVMIDGSNLITLQLYQSMKPEKMADSEYQGGISDQIMNTVGLQTLVHVEGVVDANQSLPETCSNVKSVVIMVGIFGSIFILILALAFLLSAILFFIRLPTVIFLLITSPIWVWGHVLGQFSEYKDKWMSKMKHAAIFPIVYMGYMFVGLFIFQQLLGAKTKEGTFLTLLCKSSDGDMFTKSLSVVLIFSVVITVMMKAIKYAVSEGAGTGIGSKLAQRAISRADKIQTGLTTGLRDKVKGATADLALNKTQNGLRWAGSGLSNTASGLLAKGAAKTKEGGIANGLFAYGADKFKNPKIFGKTQEQAIKDMTKSPVARQGIIDSVMDDQYTILTEEKWMKENKGKTSSDYLAYEQEQIERILNHQLGEKVLNAASGEKDSTGASITNKQYIQSKIRDSKGKLKQDSLWGAVVDRQKYHTTGKGAEEVSLVDVERDKNVLGRATDWNKHKAKAIVAARQKKAQERASKALQKSKGGAIKDREQEEYQKLEKRLSILPAVSDADSPSDAIRKIGDVLRGKDTAHILSNYDSNYTDFKKALDDYESANLPTVAKNAAYERMRALAVNIQKNKTALDEKARKLEEKILKREKDEAEKAEKESKDKK